MAVSNPKDLFHSLERLPIGVVAYNPDGNPVFANAAYKQLFGKQALATRDNFVRNYQLTRLPDAKPFPKSKFPLGIVLDTPNSPPVTVHNVGFIRHGTPTALSFTATRELHKNGDFAFALLYAYETPLPEAPREEEIAQETEARVAELEKQLEERNQQLNHLQLSLEEAVRASASSSGQDTRLALLEEENARLKKSLSLAEQLAQQTGNGNRANLKGAALEEIAHLQRELRKRDELLIEYDVLAHLGDAITGIAHEINSPMGSVQASNAEVMRLLPETIEQLPVLYEQLTTEERALFMELVQLATLEPEAVSTRDARKARRTIETILTENEIPRPDQLARYLLEANAHKKVGKFMPLLERADAHELIPMAAGIGKMQRNVANVHHATQHVLRMTRSLKAFARRGEPQSFEQIDVAATLRTTLDMLHNKLKYGVEVNADLQDELPPVPGQQVELLQVWTNLINNAVEAMEGRGVLNLTAYKAKNYLVVEVGDNGPGIPDDILPRIFDRYFTTKSEGIGTGLGLNITKRIVGQHQGKIDVLTRPGETIFRVFLPLQRTETPAAQLAQPASLPA